MSPVSCGSDRFMEAKGQAPHTLYPTQLHACDIRLLTILPSGKTDAPVECKLRRYQAETAPEYEALSYVWGDATNLVMVRCNDLDVSITRNLRKALWTMRDSETPKTIWADALCINQTNIEEKNIHVPLMGRVYSQATNTVIYLGEASLEEASAVEHGLMTVFNLLDNIRLQAGASEDDDDLILPLLERIPNQPPIDASWPTIIKFFDQDWFVRIWCVQEVVLARDRRSCTYALFGPTRIPYHCIRKVALFLAIAADCQPKLIQNIPVRRSLASVSALSHIFKQEDYLLWLLNNFRPYLATNPRDMIYGLLGILCKFSDFDPARIGVNYSKTLAEVYIDTAVEIIRVSRDLELLSHVSHPKICHFEPSFPSWVPRWDRERTALGVPSSSENRFRLNYPATLEDRNSRSNFYRVEGGKLFAYGTRYNEVNSVTFLSNSEVALATSRYWNVAREALLPCGEVQEQMLVVARTLTTGYIGFPYEFSAGTASQRNQFIADFLDFIHSIMAKCSIICPGVANGDHYSMTADRITYTGSRKRYVDELTKICKGRLLFQLANGNWGVGPDCMREGDIIVAFFGGTAPYALRCEGQEYRFLGPVYIDGLMDGQYFRSIYDKEMQKEEFILL